MRSDDETEFVPLDRWEQEYTYFQKLVKVLLMPPQCQNLYVNEGSNTKFRFDTCVGSTRRESIQIERVINVIKKQQFIDDYCFNNLLMIIVSTLFADKGVCTIPHVEGVLRMEEECAW